MKFYMIIIGFSISFIVLSVYLFYGRTVELSDSYNRSGDFYSKNSFNVFYEVRAGRGCCEEYDKKRRLVGADPGTFEVLNSKYSRDKNDLYVCSWTGPDLFRITTRCEKIENVDRNSFMPLDNEFEDMYAKDKNHVYFFGTAIANADPKTFQVFDHHHAIDKTNHYYLDGHGRLHVVKEAITNNSDINRLLNNSTPTMNAFVE